MRRTRVIASSSSCSTVSICATSSDGLPLRRPKPKPRRKMDLQYPYPPNQGDLAQAVAKLGSDLADMQRTVQAMSTGGQSSGGPPACSKKQAYTYIAEIALPQGTTARTPGTFTVSQDGP